MTAMTSRKWVPEICDTYIQHLADITSASSSKSLETRIDRLVEENRNIHERDCFNLNPATNVMNPRAEAVLSQGLGSRPSLGYPGDKYEMGLEAIEEIEVIASELSAEIFNTQFAEIRVASGAMANLYGFMVTCQPGDSIIVPPASIGGHVTHHKGGCAGLFGLDIHEAPISEDGYTVDLEGLAQLAKTVQPKLITIGGSLNLTPHPVREIREIADACGAKVMFDAAHQCGIIAGGAWPSPIAEGAHLMTMSTYKSLGGPAGGLIVTNDAALAEKLDRVAFPGMTANFDAGKAAALALSLLDWREYGKDYAQTMIDVSQGLAAALHEKGVPVFGENKDFTQSHQFAIEAAAYGGGQAASKKLRKSGFLACGIGLPVAPVEGDLNGLRMGAPELVRWGITVDHVEMLADLIAQALITNDSDSLAKKVAYHRSEFRDLHFIRG